MEKMEMETGTSILLGLLLFINELLNNKDVYFKGEFKAILSLTRALSHHVYISNPLSRHYIVYTVSWKTHFLVAWRLLVEERIANIV